MSRSFPGFEEVEPKGKRYKEILNDIKIWNVSIFFFYDIIPLFQNFLLVNICCTHSKIWNIEFFVLAFLFMLLFFSNSIKEPFLWQHRQSRQRFQKCHSKSLQFHAFFSSKENARGDQRPAVYIKSILASLSFFFSLMFCIFSRSHLYFYSAASKGYKNLHATKTLTLLTLYITDTSDSPALSVKLNNRCK